jgi:hypothetical protein
MYHFFIGCHKRWGFTEVIIMNKITCLLKIHEVSLQIYLNRLRTTSHETKVNNSNIISSFSFIVQKCKKKNIVNKMKTFIDMPIKL